MAKKQRARPAARVRHARPVPTDPQRSSAAAKATVAAAPAPRRAAPAPPRPVEAAPPIRWLRDDWLIVGFAVLAASILYWWRLNVPAVYVFDEVYHGFTSAEIVKGNADAWVWYTQPPPGVAYEWTHPALSKVLIGIGVRVFGDEALGWRAMSAVFGAAGIGLIYAMGRILFNRWVGLVAAVLLLLDGLWFVQSRIAMNDVFLATFLMGAYLSLFLYLRGPADETRRFVLLTGLFLGLAVAIKWSALYSVGLIGAIVAVREGRLLFAGRLRTPIWKVLLVLAGSALVIPVVYLLAYTQFFTMGHTWSEWRELQRQMWEYHSSLTATHAWQSRWWTWPLMIKPVWYYVDVNHGELRPATIYGMGNPLIFWAFLPAVAFAAYAWYQGRLRSAALAVVLAGFLGSWVPWQLSPRISFMYHLLPSVPFGCLAIAYALSRIREPRVVALGYLVPVLLAFVYFYPIYSAWPISRDYLEQHYWIEHWRPR